MKEKQKRGIVMALVSKKERKKIEKKRKILHSLFSPIRDETAIFHGLHIPLLSVTHRLNLFR